MSKLTRANLSKAARKAKRNGVTRLIMVEAFGRTWVGNGFGLYRVDDPGHRAELLATVEDRPPRATELLERVAAGTGELDPTRLRYVVDRHTTAAVFRSPWGPVILDLDLIAPIAGADPADADWRQEGPGLAVGGWADGELMGVVMPLTFDRGDVALRDAAEADPQLADAPLGFGWELPTDEPTE